MDLSGAHRCSMMFSPQMFNVLFPLSYSTAVACWLIQRREHKLSQGISSAEKLQFLSAFPPKLSRKEDHLGSEIICISGTTMESRCFLVLPRKGYFYYLNPQYIMSKWNEFMSLNLNLGTEDVDTWLRHFHNFDSCVERYIESWQ